MLPPNSNAATTTTTSTSPAPTNPLNATDANVAQVLELFKQKQEQQFLARQRAHTFAARPSTPNVAAKLYPPAMQKPNNGMPAAPLPPAAPVQLPPNYPSVNNIKYQLLQQVQTPTHLLNDQRARYQLSPTVNQLIARWEEQKLAEQQEKLQQQLSQQQPKATLRIGSPIQPASTIFKKPTNITLNTSPNVDAMDDSPVSPDPAEKEFAPPRLPPISKLSLPPLPIPLPGSNHNSPPPSSSPRFPYSLSSDRSARSSASRHNSPRHSPYPSPRRGMQPAQAAPTPQPVLSELEKVAPPPVSVSPAAFNVPPQQKLFESVFQFRYAYSLILT